MCLISKINLNPFLQLSRQSVVSEFRVPGEHEGANNGKRSQSRNTTSEETSEPGCGGLNMQEICGAVVRSEVAIYKQFNIKNMHYWGICCEMNFNFRCNLIPFGIAQIITRSCEFSFFFNDLRNKINSKIIKHNTESLPAEWIPTQYRLSIYDDLRCLNSPSEMKININCFFFAVPTVEYVCSSQGYLQLCVNGITFGREREMKEKTYWQCTERKLLGWILQQLDEVLRNFIVSNTVVSMISDFQMQGQSVHC